MSVPTDKDLKKIIGRLKETFKGMVKGTVTGIYDKVGNTTFYPNDDGIVTVELASGGGDSLPAGTVIPYAGATTPNGWLPCNGQEVSRDEYPALFEAIGTTYGAGDGVSTFRLPDYREAALVGIGQRASGVTNHDVYTLGQFKDDQFASHTHSRGTMNITGQVALMGNGNNPIDGNRANFFIPDRASGAFTVGAVVPNAGYDSVVMTVAQNYGRYLGFNAANCWTGTTSATGATSGGTHGKRIGVNYIIKWTRQGSSEDQNDIDTIVRNRVMAALSKANEDLYKNINMSLESTAITGFNQSYTVKNDGMYVALMSYNTAQIGGSIVIRVNGSDRGYQTSNVIGLQTFFVTLQLKKGDVISYRVENSASVFVGSAIYYMGRLDLTAGFSDDWDWGGGSGSGLTEEEVKELIAEANKPVQINTIQWDTSSSITAKADSFQCYRSGNTISLTINALELTAISGSVVTGFSRIMKGLPKPISRVYAQFTNLKDNDLKPAYICIDEDGYLNADSGFTEVGAKGWVFITYITKDG